MASFDIHLAIAKRYVEKNSVCDTQSFYKGTVEPDLADCKRNSHYSGNRDNSNLISSLENKVILKNYLLENTIDTYYDKGVFLHLITDFLFFNSFFGKKYLNTVNYDEFCNDLYYSYETISNYLEDKYLISSLITDEFILSKINEVINRSNKKINGVNKNNILPYLKLDRFIEFVSGINLYEYRDEILNSDISILPKKIETYKL